MNERMWVREKKREGRWCPAWMLDVIYGIALTREEGGRHGPGNEQGGRAVRLPCGAHLLVGTKARRMGGVWLLALLLFAWTSSALAVLLPRGPNTGFISHAPVKQQARLFPGDTAGKERARGCGTRVAIQFFFQRESTWKAWKDVQHSEQHCLPRAVAGKLAHNSMAGRGSLNGKGACGSIELNWPTLNQRRLGALSAAILGKGREPLAQV